MPALSRPLGIASALWLAVGVGSIRAQNLPSERPARPADASSLGPAIGSAGLSGDSPGSQGSILGTRPGAGSPRVPAGLTEPGGGRVAPLPEIGPLAPLAPTELPAFGPLTLPTQEDEGPADGLTLDDAIARLLSANIDLRSKYLEIPQARADVLTAGLRGNPLIFADTQLAPYGKYSPERAGGPTQYDVNITQPFDLSGKRAARTAVACQALKVLEAQYQDAVRQQIGNLYNAYVDALAARETVRFVEASVAGLDQFLEVVKSRRKAKDVTLAEVNRVEIQRESAAIALEASQSALRQANRNLALLLDIPPDQAENLALRGTLSDRLPPPPSSVELTGLALAARPDLAAYRLGVTRANADVRLARAERFSDVYVLYQPYTFQDNSPFNTKSATSWALGVTVPLPIFNRNQGNIERAKINVSQTQLELLSRERQVVAEVRQAEQDYALTRAAVERIERVMIPAATQVLDEASRLYRGGEANIVSYLNARNDYNEVVRQYRDTSVRHRRGMLNLNTALGQRLLP
ncbi:TolC family protein [Tundrisphaera sp. TA3]|uniref:TolC family protein n=1 Tax=Tundrisphaera sp. TA3 TaxID=3435775 RepID=UPI003EB76E4A